MLHKSPLGGSLFLHRTLQSLVGVPTPCPESNVTSRLLERAAAQEWGPLWLMQTVGGMQKLQPRLDDTQAGWLVIGPEPDDGRLGWCLVVDTDSSVEVRAVGEWMLQAERNAVGYLGDLAKTGVMATMPTG
jgi:hypothetical protein